MDGRGLVARIRFASRRRQPERLRLVEVPVLRMIVVRCSTGMPEQRPLIETAMCLGPVSKRIFLTITHRTGMRSP